MHNHTQVILKRNTKMQQHITKLCMWIRQAKATTRTKWQIMSLDDKAAATKELSITSATLFLAQQPYKNLTLDEILMLKTYDCLWRNEALRLQYDALYNLTSVNCLKPKSAPKFTMPQQYLTSLHLWVKPLDSLKCLRQKNMLSIVRPKYQMFLYCQIFSITETMELVLV